MVREARSLFSTAHMAEDAQISRLSIVTLWLGRDKTGIILYTA